MNKKRAGNLARKLDVWISEGLVLSGKLLFLSSWIRQFGNSKLVSPNRRVAELPTKKVALFSELSSAVTELGGRLN